MSAVGTSIQDSPVGTLTPPDARSAVPSTSSISEAVRPEQASNLETAPADAPETDKKASRKPRKARIPLSGPPEEILAKNRTSAPQFWVDKTVRLAGKHWNDFYRNHQAVPFFKDRHWTQREWDLESKLGGGEGKGKGKAVLETGCGTGAFIYP